VCASSRLLASSLSPSLFLFCFPLAFCLSPSLSPSFLPLALWTPSLDARLHSPGVPFPDLSFLRVPRVFVARGLGACGGTIVSVGRVREQRGERRGRRLSSSFLFLQMASHHYDHCNVPEHRSLAGPGDASCGEQTHHRHLYLSLRGAPGRAGDFHRVGVDYCECSTCKHLQLPSGLQ
jgi:hypothetical protein